MRGLQEVLHEQSRQFKNLHGQNDQLFIKNNDLGNALSKAEADIRRLEAEAAARQEELKLFRQDRHKSLQERDGLREEKQSLLTEVEILRDRVKLSEDQAAKFRKEAQDKQDALQEARIVQHEEKMKTEAALLKLKAFEDNDEENLAKAYNEGVTEAYAKIKADLPGLELQARREGWFLALQKLKLDPDQVGMARGPAANAKLPPTLDVIIDLEEEEEVEDAKTDSDIEKDDQDIIPQAPTFQPSNDPSLANPALPMNSSSILVVTPELDALISDPHQEIIFPVKDPAEAALESATVPEDSSVATSVPEPTLHQV